MTNDIWHIIIYFMVYAVLGWVWETVYVSYQERRFVYRGFLTGPYCPIYGFGVLLLLTTMQPLYDKPWLLFIVSMVVMSVLEYGSSYVLEKLFRQRWWDYSDEPLNIGGRIAVKSSLFWGVMCVVIVLLLQPYVVRLADAVLQVGVWLPLLMVALLAVDTVHTVVRLAGFNRLIRALQTAVAGRSEPVPDVVGQRVAQLRRRGMPRITERRILLAYPHATRTHMQNYAEIREQLLKLRR